MEDLIPWLPFILTLVTAILGNIPAFLSYISNRSERKQKKDSDALTVVAQAGAAVSKTYQELLPVMRERIKELEGTLASVKKRLTQAESELEELREQLELMNAELSASKAESAARLIHNRQLIDDLREKESDLSDLEKRAGRLGDAVQTLIGQLQDHDIKPAFKLDK